MHSPGRLSLFLADAASSSFLSLAYTSGLNPGGGNQSEMPGSEKPADELDAEAEVTFVYTNL